MTTVLSALYCLHFCNNICCILVYYCTISYITIMQYLFTQCKSEYCLDFKKNKTCMAKNQTKKRGRTKLSYKKTWCWHALEGKVKAFTFLSSTSSSWIETEMNMTNTPIKYLTLWSPIRMKKSPMGGKYENMCLQLCTACFSTVVMKKWRCQTWPCMQETLTGLS